jgi:LysM repeat protein
LTATTTVQLRAQEAAVEERLKQLNGYVQDLQEDKANQRKQIEALSKELQALREAQSQPNTSYVTQDELRKLAERVQEIDKKREADKELILKEIQQLGKAVANPPKVIKPKPVNVENPGPGGGTADKGYEYVVQSGDSLSIIAAAYKEKGVKVTTDQILKANPGLKPEKLKVGQKIFIPGTATN